MSLDTIRLRHFISLILLTALLALSGCGSSDNPVPVPVPVPAPATSAKFAVFSDPHIFDAASLCPSGGCSTSPEFQAYLVGDRKMLVESVEILDSVISDLKSKTLDFIIVSGDLTKDGELVNHQLMATRLAALKASGKKIFVIPGNHDINNPHAISYKTSPATPVSYISPTEFKQIYAEYGYRDALYSDPNSLSYIAEPVNGLWLFALDSCQYDTNIADKYPKTAGAFKPATLTWILDRLKDAKQQGKTVIGMMHHGILEHYAGQTVLFPEYVLTDFATVSKSLSDNGLNVMFTGHFHANDVTLKDFTSSVLHDIETGSTVSAPSPYRTINFDIANKKLAISTATVTSIPSHPTDFVAYSQKYMRDGLTMLTPYQLAKSFGLTYEQVMALIQAGAIPLDMIVNGFMAHYAGDEKPDTLTQQTYQAMMQSSDTLTKTLGQSLYGIWTDLPPADNNVTITINSTK